MAVVAQTGLYVALATATTSAGTPGGTAAPPSGTTLSSASDISQWVTGIQVPVEAAEVPTTNFGGGGYESFVAGLKSGVVTLNLNQDFAAASINALLGLAGSVGSPGASTNLYIEVKPTSASRSATNPSFVAKVIHRGWSPFNAKVGDVSTIDLTLRVTGGFAELTS